MHNIFHIRFLNFHSKRKTHTLAFHTPFFHGKKAIYHPSIYQCNTLKLRLQLTLQCRCQEPKRDERIEKQQQQWGERQKKQRKQINFELLFQHQKRNVVVVVFVIFTPQKLIAFPFKRRQA